MSFFSFQDIMACVTGIMILTALIMALDPLSDKPSISRTASEANSIKQEHSHAVKRVADAEKAIAEATAALEDARSRPQVTAEQLARMERLLGSEREGLVALERAREEADGDARRREDQAVILDREVALALDKARAIKQDLADKTLRSRVSYQSGVIETMQPLLLEVTPTGIAVGHLDGSGTPRRTEVINDTATDRLINSWREGMAKSEVNVGGGVSKPLSEVLKSHPREQWYALLVVRQDSIGASNGLRDLLRGSGYEVGWQLWNAEDGGFFDTPVPEAGP
ncbi:MAG: hypothetical protein EXS03_09355 [Phycisphaerales bacterium]|nr:hypothetical protein [Phycisphaerales bacterium]